uniref:acylphosphatase n=1 Tax=Glossina austeni TaxID=7395 RepID=A0A1A9VAT6_GLOAU
MGTRQLYGCDFEVYGKVQRVFFRKYTASKAKDLGLHGWCKNTIDGSVKGQMEGTQQELNDMKYWLQNKGSPKSRIDGFVKVCLCKADMLVRMQMNVEMYGFEIFTHNNNYLYRMMMNNTNSFCYFDCKHYGYLRLPLRMNFPAFASKVAERITAFNVHTMDFILNPYLKTIHTVLLRIGYH